MDSGNLERHLRRMRRLYHERRDAMTDKLDELEGEGFELSFRSPDGGMATWIGTGVDTGKLREKAQKAKIYIQPETDFRVDRKAGTHMRLGFACLSPSEINQGLSELFSLI